MIYSNTPNPPCKFTATMYGKSVTIEMDHSDIDLTELMEVFKGLAIASGFANDSWDSVIKELSANIHDYEREDLKEKLNEWKFDDEDEDEYKDLRHSYGGWAKDSEGYESAKDIGRVWTSPELEREVKEYFANVPKVNEEEPNEDESNRRMDIIGQNGNEGTHYGFDWDSDYEGETNDILTNINDSITMIKDRMEDIDLRMDNIDEQLGILNADVANIEFNIQHPIKEALLNAKVVYDKSVIETERFNKVKEAAMRYSDEVKAKHVPIKDFDVVDMESGEVSATNEVSNDGGFDGKALFTPYKRKPNQAVTQKKMNKSVVKKGKIKDLKK